MDTRVSAESDDIREQWKQRREDSTREGKNEGFVAEISSIRSFTPLDGNMS